MIGNLSEWVAEWHTRPADNVSIAEVSPWPLGDVSVNVENSGTAKGGPQEGLPLVEQRGGHWSSGIGAGAFAMNITDGPVTSSDKVGFRCVIPR